jgi:protein-tyrosine phosphatase
VSVDRPRVLVVCTANVARSPLFAAMLTDRLGADVEVVSAGVRARVGDPAAEASQQLASARGLDVSGHRSQPVTADLVRSADLVLTMSERQRDACGPLAPGAGTRTFTLREFARLLADVDDAEVVPDAPGDRLRWLQHRAHGARPRSLPPTATEDIADPIRRPWEDWLRLGFDLDDLLERIWPSEA